MFNRKKYSTLDQIRRLKNAVLQFSHLPFDDVLSTEVLQNIVQHSNSRRNRLFTPLITLKAFIFQSLNTDGSCRQAVSHVLSERLLEGQAANSIHTGRLLQSQRPSTSCTVTASRSSFWNSLASTGRSNLVIQRP